VKNKIETDHREFSRIDIKITAKLQAKGRKVVSSDTHDVSMKGLFVTGKTDWPMGTECDIHLILEGLNPPVDIKVKGRVQRLAEEGMGLLFTEIGLEAYECLRNLILLNTDDTKKVEQEFKNHLGLKKK